MNVKELRELLANCNDDDEVVIDCDCGPELPYVLADASEMTVRKLGDDFLHDDGEDHGENAEEIQAYNDENGKPVNVVCISSSNPQIGLKAIVV